MVIEKEIIRLKGYSIAEDPIFAIEMTPESARYILNMIHMVATNSAIDGCYSYNTDGDFLIRDVNGNYVEVWTEHLRIYYSGFGVWWEGPMKHTDNTICMESCVLDTAILNKIASRQELNEDEIKELFHE
jgi:hypothetical protein